MNNVARVETEENLIKAVESLNVDSVKELLSRFSFNQYVLKDLTVQIIDKDLDLAEILIKNTDKTTKKLEERVDL